MNQWFSSDKQFNGLYPEAIQKQSAMHWTPLHIARKVAEFLAAGEKVKVLDIGSGTGKFCLTAARYHPEAFFYGIEQRAESVQYAIAASVTLGLQNVAFIQGNITQANFSMYDHFYFFNAFYENLADEYLIDQDLSYSRELYSAYNRHVFRQLEKKPAGTRLATFHSMEDEIPPSFYEVASTEDNLLKFWTKVY